MRIYKSIDADKFIETITSGVAGQIFYCSTETGEPDLGFELQRKVPDILKDLDICPAQMFDIIWQLEEDFDKMEYIYSSLITRFDLSKKECQDLIEYLHLNIPRNEKGNAIHLKTWKKQRNREQLWQEYANDEKDGQRLRLVNDAYLMKQILTRGTNRIGYLLDAMKTPEFARITHFGEPVKNPNFVNEKDR